MGPWEQTAMSVDRVTRQQFLDDVTDMIGQAFLAHPLQCARCHDHKFDPIPTRDYYRIQAVFATTQFAEPDVPWLPDENRQGFDAPRKYLRERIAFFQDVLRRLDEKQERAERAWYAQRNLPYAPRSQKLKEGVPESEIAPRHVGFTAEDLGIQRIANKYLHRHRWELDRYAPIALSVYSGPTPQRRSVQSRLLIPQDLAASGTVEHTAILAGGDPFSPTLPVTPGVLSVVTGILSPRDVAARSSITSQVAGRRAEFARWLTDPTRNPITPRVLVNRLWQHHFGRGIVATANNFGTAAARPTHPQLLEYLAVELVRSGWSAKHIHRLILTSDTYCRAHRYPDSDSLRERELAEKDPLATSWARRTIRRMEAEELHDSILTVSGLLNREIGGVPVCPDINLEVAAQPRQIMGTYAPVYQPSPLPADRNRRSLYALRLRGLPDPMLEVFNQPPPDRPCEMRDSSTVAPQALTLLNSPYSYNRAAAMARHLMREVAGPDPASDREPQEVDAAIIDRAFQWALGRPASDAERQECLAHWRAMTERHRRIELSDTIPPAEVTRMFVDENTGEQFAFTEPLERNRDYVPDLRLSQTDPRWRGLADVCLVLLSSNEFVYVP
ncbi:MAG: DUF1553 domain-containing protein [Planctomycetota bacterium]|nr:MAG: DUF1553 domain-containing protein [Planctomycetota bacterium]